MSDMISELLTMLDALQGEPFFYLEDGPLKNRLVESYMEEEDVHAELPDFEHNASLRINQGAGAARVRFICRLETGDFSYQTLFSAEDFGGDEIAELLELLRPLCALTGEQKTASGRSIIRKSKDPGLLGISAAATLLCLSPRQLKSLIPCSETRIVTEGGARHIEEYYWDKELIDRFAGLWQRQQEGRGYNDEDLAFIAAGCCDGDRHWARDCIVGFLTRRKLSASHFPE